MDSDHGGHDRGQPERTTAPQQAYGSREVGIGLAVLAAGLVVTFGVALALA